ncbi:MAG: OmpA family protein [Sandaracinaceae bacterium]|nr:OmpA family protein [Sandaracinaceae bacterium]
MMISIQRTLLLLGLALAAMACGPSQHDLDEANARARELEARLNETEARRAALEQRVNELDSANADLLSRLGILDGEKENLASTLDETKRALAELREREAQSQQRLASYRQIMERFRAAIDAGRLRVRAVRNRLVVELPSGILFPSGSSSLKRGGDAEATLREVADVLREIDDREFQIAGHTDNIPITSRNFANNWDLSLQRARTVLEKLIELGIPEKQLSAAGHADTHPVADNDTEEGRQLNRRIEIVLMPNLDELPDLSALDDSSN